MKTYQITLLTKQGIVIEIYKDSELLGDFERRMINKYPDSFIMVKSQELEVTNV